MPAQEHPEGSNTAAGASTDGSGEYVRLHITPLDSELFNIIIPASVLPAARNVSYHTIDTFPEKRYGFVELPETHAEKLKKKLNGSVLRGSKIRIEKARPAKQMEPPAPTEMPVKKRKKPADGLEAPKKRKRDVDVVEGVTLRDRKVKRGWTESVEEKKKNKKNKDKESRDKAEKRKRPKSKYTDQEECLLKVKMPPNAMANLPQEAHKKKRKRGNTREVTVHEFEKTTKFPSFLKTSVPESGGKTAIDYVEGKGWVDEDGNVVEEVKVKAKRTLANAPAAKQKAVEAEQETGSEEDDDDDSTSSSGSSSEEDDDSEVGVPGKNQESTSDLDPKARLKSGSSSEAPSDSGSEDEDDSPPAGPATTERLIQATLVTSAKTEIGRPQSSSSSKSLTIKIPPPGTPAAQVHPLEALYKRHKPADDTAEAPSAAEPFSFFSGGNDEDIEEEEEQDHQGDRPAAIPMTPFTKQDFERRNIRSAAPTPDTAHPSRAKNFWAPAEDDEEPEDIADGDEDEHAAGPTEKSDFQTWFWENRGDLNRSWMTRRKMASKEKRHRENKARASKAI
ncbi:suppressor protein srp40 protein [Purpureocillium lilacinum]|uniref:Suppressor protein srp40 protein n=1 Tax=Purpureocillium lilacinum TaxID=33203 RepID=A0A179HTW0_PURLI|nr:suppressor protein srp40 protein [Purpureocillium lilacinum]OAQ93484.1 suppressor protein srp40 protein [Purpureocillium lilacinum]